MRERIAAGRLALALLLAALLSACGPGSGGTGLPPPGPSGGLAAPAPSSGAPDLAGPIERVGADALRIGATLLPLAEISVVSAAGEPLPADVLVDGLPVLAWRIDGRWVVQPAP